MPAAAFWAFYRGGEHRGAILTVHSLEFMSAVIADKFCHSSKHKLFLSCLDYSPQSPPSACGYCIPDDRFWFGRTKVLISCNPYKSIMVHGLQIHFNFSVFPIVAMLLFLFYGCKDTTKLCQIVAWQRRKYFYSSRSSGFATPACFHIYKPSRKNLRRWILVMPSSSFFVRSGVMEMTYLG